MAELREKDRRVYYQGIVYEVCNLIDMHLGNQPGRGLVCGTADSPTDQVQQALCDIFNRIKATPTATTEGETLGMDALYHKWINTVGRLLPYEQIQAVKGFCLWELQDYTQKEESDT